MRSGRLRSFEWLKFFRSYHIEYVERGPNVARNHVNIRCPFCGDGDPSHHMGISLHGEGWGCWRSKAHGGLRPHRLIVALLKCSYFEAQRIVGDDPLPELKLDRDFAGYVKGMLSPAQFDERKKLARLRLPSTFHRLHNCISGPGRFFVDYLTNRDYHEFQIDDVCAIYDLHYAITGDFTYRVIFPIRMFNQIMTWTGRTITRNGIPRYKTLTTDPEKLNGSDPALRSIKDCLFNYDDLCSAPMKRLVVVEGPFDAMRMDYFGFDLGIRSTCLFSKTISEEQLLLLEDIAPMFDERILLFDPDAELDLLPTMDQLAFLKFQPMRLPHQFEDPAVLNQSDIQSLFGIDK